jgi:5-methylcytosine-specific restriction endonuclease McrA
MVKGITLQGPTRTERERKDYLRKLKRSKPSKPAAKKIDAEVQKASASYKRRLGKAIPHKLIRFWRHFNYLQLPYYARCWGWFKAGERDFGVWRKPSEKLQILKSYAPVKEGAGHSKKYQWMRDEYSRRSGDFWFVIKCPCFICGGVAEHKHHIVPLANGGINHCSNMVPLCGICHSKVHPWMEMGHDEAPGNEHMRSIGQEIM